MTPTFASPEVPLVLPPKPRTVTVALARWLVIVPPVLTYVPMFQLLSPAPPPVPSTSTAPPLEVILEPASTTYTPKLLGPASSPTLPPKPLTVTVAPAAVAALVMVPPSETSTP